MSDHGTIPARRLIGIVLGTLLLAIGLRAMPGIAGAAPSALVAANTPEASDAQSLSVFVSIPLNRIKDGQFCQAYAVVSGGTGNYTDFEWTGQFTGSGQPGPLGPGQIINGFVSSSAPLWLRVDVTDSNNNTGWGIAQPLQIDASYSYNEDCEA